MSSPGKSSKALLIRLAVLIVLGLGAVAAVKLYGSPAAISRAEVQSMLDQRELIGLSIDEAAAKLQHTAPPTQDGLVLFDFAHIRGWTAGSLALDVRSGKVFSASWHNDAESRD